MSEQPFIVDHQDGVAHLRFTRPHAANALNMAFWDGFPGAVRQLEAEGRVRALVISGDGRHFCAGMDLSVFRDPAFQHGEAGAARERFMHVVRRLQAALSVLENVRFPVVAAIQGACVGAGLDLASACDLRFAAPDAYFRIEEINIGMMADVGSLQRLPKLLPDAVLREMAFCGTTLHADRALQLGFVNGVDEHAFDQAMKAAREIASRAPLAVSGSKRAISFARDHSVAESLEQVALLQSAIWHTPDILGAMQARADKVAGHFADLLPL